MATEDQFQLESDKAGQQRFHLLSEDNVEFFTHRLAFVSAQEELLHRVEKPGVRSKYHERIFVDFES